MQINRLTRFAGMLFSLLVLGSGPSLSLARPNTIEEFALVETPLNGSPQEDLPSLAEPQYDTAQKLAELDEHFLSYKKAYDRQDFSVLQSIQLSQFSQYPLKDYVQAWYLLGQASTLSTSDSLRNALAFLSQHETEPVGDYFGREWLTLMADRLNKENRWKSFQQIRSRLKYSRNDTALQCWEFSHQLQSASAKKLSALSSEAVHMFKQARFENNPVCKKAFDTLIDNVPSLGFTRLVTLMQLNRGYQAKKVLQILIDHKRLPRAAALQAFDHPQRWYRQHRKSLARQNKFIALIASYRMARTDLATAAAIARSQKHLTKDERAAVWGHIAYTAALRLEPKAGSWYRLGGPSVCRGRYAANSTSCLEWQVRLALKEQNWSLVEQSIQRLPASIKQSERWRYWLGRALQFRGQHEQAARLWEQNDNVRTFYGKLSAEALGKAFVYLPDNIVTLDSTEAGVVLQRPSLTRAETFYNLGLYGMGHREWNRALEGLNDIERLAVARWAREHLLLDRMINTAIPVAQRMPVDPRVLYPDPYRSLVEKYAAQYQLDPCWVYGLIRQESRFISVARSSVGANGLMQIMPATAQWIAKQLPDPDFQMSRINDIETNIRYGTFYLRSLLNRLDNNLTLATAGYNAGPLRSQKWRAALPCSLEGAIFIENIPFTETRNYVQNVIANTIEYKAREGSFIKSMKAWLGEISPKAAVEDENNI
ncbi:MAG TPA: lytic transglycosylase domain-containing protein [Candidatus Aphodousia gallistercoris]|nr:lytic transglycosylase domain-containing protein [Candidatus Aphodousia gallistercoris]